jgi:mRNA-degrading endonuclease RelE of RelBE toxin-antitoxin system
LSAGKRRFELRVARPAARSIREDLPEAVAAAVIELLTGDLLTQPRRVGKPLQRELAGIWSARRGSYRILFRIDDEALVVTVLAVEHRLDACRQRQISIGLGDFVDRP